MKSIQKKTEAKYDDTEKLLFLYSGQLFKTGKYI